MDANQSVPLEEKKKETFGDTYCGADRGMFRWCQTISDLDVVVCYH